MAGDAAADVAGQRRSAEEGKVTVSQAEVLAAQGFSGQRDQWKPVG